MKHNRLFWFIFVLIITFTWIDYQYFTEGHALHYSPFVRQAGHLFILFCLIPLGYWGWAKYPIKWFSKLWLYSYLVILISIGTIGLIQWKTALFSVDFLDHVSSLRMFFCSPVPFFMLYILHRVISRNSSGS